MNILQIANRALGEMGLASLSSLIGNSDRIAFQVKNILKNEVIKLSRRYEWQALIEQTNFTTIAIEDQGLIRIPTSGGGITYSTPLFNDGFDYIINNTIWNRTLNVPIYGPMSPSNYQAQKSSNLTGPYSQYRIRDNHLRLFPAPAAGQSIFVEYKTKYLCIDYTGVKSLNFTRDDDELLIDYEAAILGIIWRLKKEKGLEYAEDFNDYETMVNDLIGRDSSAPILSMDQSRTDLMPGIMVPIGSWSV